MFEQYKFSIEAPSVADKVSALQFVPDKQKGDVFRIREIKLGLENRDAVATGDKVGIQISTKSRDAEDELYDIDSEYEVFTYQEAIQALGTNGSTVVLLDTTKCMDIPVKVDIKLKSGKKYFINSIITGQDAADVITHAKFLAQYENSKNAEKYDSAHSQALA
jgi:hypothetical protein